MKQNKEQAMLYAVGVLWVLCMVEIIIGFKNKNVHLIKDFVTSGLLSASIYISRKANEAA